MVWIVVWSWFRRCLKISNVMFVVRLLVRSENRIFFVKLVILVVMLWMKNSFVVLLVVRI